MSDRYELHDALGRGGMGTVWAAEDCVLRREVAVKEVVIPSTVPGDEQRSLRARAMREAQAAARLNHPNAVTIFDVREEGGRAYIVMELVRAPTLKDVVENEGPLDPGRAARVGAAVAAALGAAHEQGIVHRDVKPANVMVGDDGRVKLADFGIASLKGDPKITATGMVLGSPPFMAPEQARGQESGPPADLWALGATLYYAVEGKPPFDRGQAIATLSAILSEDPPPARNAGRLGPVISALLSKDPRDRPGIAQLERMLGDVGRADEPARTRRDEPPARSDPAPTRRAPAPPRRSRWLVPALAVVLLAIAAALAWSALRSSDEPVERVATGRRDRAAAAPRSPSPSPSPSPTPTPSPSPSPSPSPAGGGVPAAWEDFEDAEAGYAFAYPPGWTIAEGRGGVPNNRDFVDPATGNYLRVAWRPDPGPSPEGAWEDLSASFAQTHAGYEEIQITPTRFKGMDAALWEYSWVEGGAQLHAYDLGFVTENRGFALNFVAEEDDWDESQRLWRRFKAAFEVTGP